MKILRNHAILLFSYLCHKHRRTECGITSGLDHAFIEILSRYIHGGTEIEGVELLDLTRYHHQVVYGLIINQKPAVSVKNLAPSRILRYISQSVIIRRMFIRLVDDLNHEQLNQQN